MRKLTFVAALLALLVVSTSGVAQKPYKVMFYNLENFFDTIDDPNVSDAEFTPQAAKKWNTEKYYKKLHNIERVLFDIAAINQDYPAVIGVSEIENRNVLEDIVATPKLSPARYRISHYDSPDRRGVDVAFFYRPDVFKLEGDSAVKAYVPEQPDFLTRDILTMWGTIDGEPFFFMVAHWPSRLGGKEVSEFKRVALGRQTRAIADSVRRANPATKVVIMGDLNDDPTDKSIAKALGAKGKLKEVGDADYYAPYTEMLKAGLGTLGYDDAWNIFDNIIVSGNLVHPAKGTLRIEKGPGSKYYGNIFKARYLIQQDGRYRGYPLRTFVSDNFQNGFSDHLPVYIYLGK
ncbi:MAG: endonuclease/exonuclease/phosphatase family protein [Mediterranea sp.]|jgi:predicted extracellular nuclease|nr:endonuclease/exonuclease/phosphatase family protein [Mediterranea sp.]